MFRDFRFAWRRLRLAPAPALFAVATLTLGIGAATATYSVVETVLWRPLAVADESRLLVLSRTNMMVPGPIRVSSPELGRLQDGADRIGLRSVAGWREFDATVVGHGRGVNALGDFVTPNYFSTLGVKAQAGRLLGSAGGADDRAAVLSDAAWRSQFAADPAVVGTSIRVANQTFVVVGVAPPGFRGMRPQSMSYPSVWLPMSAAPAVRVAAGWIGPMTDDVNVVLRAAPSHTASEAAEAIAAYGLALDRTVPLRPTRFADGSTHPQPRYWTAIGTADDARFDSASEMGRVIVCFPGLVLLIACSNIANLVLSRGASRRQDFGVRRALGASRWQLVREQLVEQALVAVVGGLGAAALATWLVASAARVMQTTLAPFVSGAPIDWHVHGGIWPAVIFGIVLSVLVSGLIPALQLTRDSLRSVVAQGNEVSTPRWRGRGNLIALQLGVSVGLFLIALVFVHIMVAGIATVRAKVGVSSEVDRSEALATVAFTGQGRDLDDEHAYVDRVLGAIDRSVDVEAAAATTAPTVIPGLERPLYSASLGNNLSAEMIGAKPLDRRTFAFAAVSPSYFSAVRIPFLHGAVFAADEPAFVVSQDLARGVFGVEDVVGRPLTVTIHDGTPASSGEETATIVGVVPASAANGSSSHRTAVLYAPFARHAGPTVTFIARGHQGRSAPTEPLTRALASVDPEIAVSFVSTAEIVANGPLAFAGYIAAALFTLAGLALGMATVGLYGVLSHVIARRTREFGIRVALGATPHAITRLVLRDGFRPILEGLFIGLATAAVTRFFMLRTMVQETVASIDLIGCALSFALLAVAGAVACWLPARRATRVTPTEALRSL